MAEKTERKLLLKTLHCVSSQTYVSNVKVSDLNNLCLMHCTLSCFLLPGNRHQWPAWVCYKVCKATKAGKPWSWTPNCDAFLAVKEKLSQRQNPPPALLPDQNVNRTPQLMVSLSSDCGLNWVQLLGRRMTVTPYGGEQHVFHIPAGESSSLRLSHSLPP